MKKKSKRRNYNKYGTAVWIFGEIALIALKVILALALCIILLILNVKLDPKTYTIVLNSVASAVILFFTFVSRKRPPLKEKLISCAVALSLWVPLMIGTRKALIIDTAVLWALLAYLTCMYIFKGKKFSVLNGEALYLSLLYVSSAFLYTFADESGYLKFIILPAILAIATIPITVILLEKGKIELDKPTFTEGVLTVLAVSFLSFIMLFLTICNLNFSLDFSTPTEERAIIKDTYFSGGGRTPTHYSLLLDINGEEIEFEASPEEYLTHDVGDIFYVELYKGAFGAKYYISGQNERKQ